MSRWSEEFDNHVIHTTLSDTLELLDTKVENIGVEFADKFKDERRRLIKVISMIDKAVKGIDAEYFPPVLFNDTFNEIVEMCNNLEDYPNEDSAQLVAKLTEANDHLTRTMPEICKLPQMARSVKAREVIKSAEAAFEKFTKNMEDTAVNFQTQLIENTKKIKNLNPRVDGLGGELEALKYSFGEKLNKWQEEFTKNESDREDKYSASGRDREDRFTSYKNESETNFAATIKDIISNYNVKLVATDKSFKADAKAIKTDMDEKHDNIKKLHGLVGVDSVAGGYKKNADDEKRQASLWRWISIVALISAAIWPAFKFFGWFKPLEGGTFNWPEIITAASLISIFLGIAAYTSKQSKMHRDNERISRSFALETKALDPFMSSLEPTEQQQIKGELIRKMFGQQYREKNNTDTTVVTLPKLPSK